MFALSWFTKEAQLAGLAAELIDKRVKKGTTSAAELSNLS